MPTTPGCFLVLLSNPWANDHDFRKALPMAPELVLQLALETLQPASAPSNKETAPCWSG